MAASTPLALHDEAPESADFLDEALAGLRAVPKTLPCKFFYDETGSRLFDEICELPEYYPTRTELSIMREHAPEMARHLGPDCLLVEYGSGSSEKTRVLLDSLVPCAYVPVDISRDHLLASCNALAAEYPQVEVLPVCADFTAPFALPVPERVPTRTVAYFPGSTIGNFEREDAVALLHSIRTTCGRSGALLVGADLVKDRETLECAYDDSRGVTAAFNRNLLVRLNAELGADFAPDRFAHEARWLAGPGRIEMHLVSRRDQTVRLGGRTIAFRAGESICTEHSHKYTLDGFAAMADEAGFGVERVFCDEQRLFSVQLLGVR